MPSYDDLTALFVNCSLKRSTEQSHTQGLMDRSIAILEEQGVSVETIRLADYDVAPGVQFDMREHGWAADAWPDVVWPRVQAADMLVVGSALWLGEPTSVASRFIERLYAMTGETNDRGQPVFYGKVGGAGTTGDEDGVKNSNRRILYSLQHLGFTIPPAAETGWIGEIGPGPSYLDEGSGGPENEFTTSTLTAMSWNLLHLARMLKDAGGIPAVGNVTG
jgi:multimeric flavodoxin WrbA